MNIIRSIGMICLLTALGEVFVIEWLKEIHKFSHITLSMLNLVLAFGFGFVAWKTFRAQFDELKLTIWVIIVMMFLNLGFAQMIYQNYSKLDDYVIAILNKYTDTPNQVIYEIGNHKQYNHS